jgi:hypothetical protein
MRSGAAHALVIRMILTAASAVMRRRRTVILSSIGIVCAGWACAHRPNTLAQQPGDQQSASNDETIRAKWIAQRAADSACATLPFVRMIPGQTEWNVHRDPKTGRECALGTAPDAPAYVLDGKLLCPPPDVWKRVVPPDAILALRPHEINTVEVRKDSVAFATWSCPGRVDGVIVVTTGKGTERR